MSFKTKRVEPSDKHKQFHKDFADYLKSYCDKNNISNLELLAIASYVVGQILALQDKNILTIEQAITIVNENIQSGNQFTMLQIMEAQGHG